MSAFIGAALPWMGGKVSDLLGFAGRDSEGEGDDDETISDENTAGGGSGGRSSGGEITAAAAVAAASSEASNGSPRSPSSLSSKASAVPASSSPRGSRVLQGRGRSSRRRYSMVVGSEKGVTKAAVTSAIRMCSPSKTVDKKTSNGSGKGDSSLRNAPVRRVRNRAQGSPPSQAVAALSKGAGRGEGSGDTARSKIIDASAISGGSNRAKNSTISPRRRTTFHGETRGEADWRVPCSGSPATANAAASVRRKSGSLSSGSTANSARASKASSLLELDQSPAVSRGGGRAGDGGKDSLVEASVDVGVDNTLSVVADGGKKKRRADAAGLSSRRSGSDSGQAKRRASSAAEAGREDGKLGVEKPGKKSDSDVLEGGGGAVAFAAPRPEATIFKATLANERHRSASPTPASDRSQERRTGGGFSLRSRAELRKPAFLRGEIFSSSINKVESVHRSPQKTPPRSGGSGRKRQNERLLARLPSPPQADEASASTNGFAKDGSFRSAHDHDHDDDGPRLGGYNGSLIANGCGGNAWRTPRVRRQGFSLPVNEGGDGVEDGVLVPRPFLWARNGAHVSPARGGNAVVASGSGRVGNNNDSSASTSSVGGFGCGSSGNNDASDGSHCKDGRFQSSPSSASAAAINSAVNVSPATVAAAPAPVAPGRLAWCGDRRLLPRPSATLQLRRHVPSLSSPGAAQSAVTAAYLGRLDLIADSSEAESLRLRGVGNGWHEGRSKNTGDVDGQSRSNKKKQDRSARAAAGGDAPASPFNSSAGDGQGGISICKKNCWGEKVEAEAEASTAVTLSSSGVSATSGEEEEDSDSDEIFMMVIDDSDELDYYPSSSPSGVLGAGDCESAGETCESAENGVQSVSKVSKKGCSVKRAGSLLEGEEPTVVAGKAAVAKAAKAAAFSRGEATKGRTPIASRAPLSRGRGSNSDAEEESRSAPSCCPGDARLVAVFSPLGIGTAGGNRTQKAVRPPSCATDASAASRSDTECFTAEHRLPTSRARTRVRTSVGEASAGSGTSFKEPLVPPQPPVGPRKWPPRPPHRALVYAAAAEASRHARGFTGWSFPALPPPLPRPHIRKPVETAPLPTAESETVENTPRVEDDRQEDKEEDGAAKGVRGRGRRGRNVVRREEEVFLGFARENPPGKPSPNQLGWMALDPMHTAEGRAAVKKRALERKRRAIELAAKRKREELENRRKELERIALQKRQEILDALRIKEEIAEERRKRKLNILFLGMTRVAEYDSRGGLAKGMKRFELVEKMVRHDVDETNMNPLRDTARVLAMEALGHEVRCISKVSTPGESDSESSRSTRAKGGPTGLGRFLATDMTNTGASRGFLRRIEEKWSTITFDTILLDHYWLPDSVVWLNKGYMANDGGLIQNLVKMTTTKLLRDDFEIMLPINQAFFELLLPHFKDLEKHFTVEFLVGERLEHLKRSHLALEADDLIPADVMLNTYGKEREHQVSQMLGVKQPTAEVAAILLKYGVAAQHFCYARFLKLSRNPPPHPALAAVALTAASAAAKIAEESARIAAEQSDLAAQSAKEISEFDEKENRAAAADAEAALGESTEARASCGSVKDVSRRS